MTPVIVIGLAAFLALLAGSLHGGREAFHADPYIFEKRFGVADISFFGSLSWLRKYPVFDHTRKEREFYTAFSDFWHVAGWMGKCCLIASSLLISSLPENIGPLILSGFGIFAGSALGSRTAYTWLMHKRLI
jgi:glutathione S-transferase